MLKPLTVNYQGREITLECTHKKTFPPPQMYGSTPDDIDNLWKQGAIDQNQHQHLKVWQENCGLMVMGPRCLDCKLALKQNPRPGRPHVIETEPWLPVKRQMRWDDMKTGKLAPEPLAEQETPVDPTPTEPARHEPVSKQELAEKAIESGILDSEPDTPPSTEPTVKPLTDALENPDEYIAEDLDAATADLGLEEDPEEEEVKEAPGLADDLLDALAED